MDQNLESNGLKANEPEQVAGGSGEIVPVREGLTMEETMEIILIAEAIFRRLPAADLYSCSLVNMRWNSVARATIMKHRRCMAIISDLDPCKYIRDLNEFLEDANSHPYNGLDVSTDVTFRNGCSIQHSSTDDPNPHFTNILSKIDLRNLKICWSEHTSCLAVALLKRILKEKARNIEFLHLDRLPGYTPRLSESFGYTKETRRNWFPKLKVLQVKPVLKHTEIFEDMLASAPNLTEFVGSVCPRNIDIFLRQKKFHTISHFDLVSLFNFDDTTNAIKFVRMQPQLKKLTVAGLRFLFGKPVREWLDVLHMYWLCCETCLEELEVNHLDLILINDANFPPLLGVTTLTVTFDTRLVKRDGQPKLRNIDFAKLFPNVRFVRIHPDFDEPINYMDIFVNNELTEMDSRFVCKTVTKLELVNIYDKQPSRFELLDLNPSLQWTMLLSLAKIFPDVRHISIRGTHRVVYFCDALWTAWKDMESICFSSVSSLCSFKVCIDTCIIGISEPEWKYWNELKHSQHLDFNKLQFAPIRSSLRNCNKLQKLRIEFAHHKNSCGSFEPTFLTDLSGACAFSRVPGLEVEVVRTKNCNVQYYSDGVVQEIPCNFTLNSLYNYARFIDDESPPMVHPREHMCSWPF